MSSDKASAELRADEGEKWELDDSDLARLRSMLYRRTGLSFAPSHHQFLRNRVSPRMQASGETTFGGYLRRLDSAMDTREMQSLVNAVTVNETHFFRELYQFDCLVDSLLGEVVAGRPPGSTVRLWSLPCSTGEEPYSIALQLLERWPLVDQYNVEILGSDIDTRVLQSARAGVYSERSLRDVPAHYRERYFSRAGDNWRLSDAVRASVDFSHVNISDPRQTGQFHDVDVVFCRNLLIYFDDESRLAATQNLYRALRPGGFACLGHSESMARISSQFATRRFPQAVVFQKPKEQR